MKKVLIISYYWPPSGGAGVQRWVKFTKYLREFNCEPIVYVPENPEYPSQDDSFMKDIPQGVQIIKRKIWEPYNIYRNLFGKKGEAIPAGFISEKTKSGWKEKLSIAIRGNLLIPDPRKFWIRPSIKFLSNYLKENQIDAVISTGPPHSMHLIAMGLKMRFPNIKWIADFRDPWTNIDFYKELQLSSWADKKHHRLEKLVVQKADELIVVSKNMVDEFQLLSPKSISLIPNGFDTDDMPENQPDLDKKFTISHIGTMNAARNPLNLWRACGELIRESEEFAQDLQIQLIGKVDYSVIEEVNKNGLVKQLRKVDYLPHHEAIARQQSSQILLLLINNSANAKGILTGKFFEYLASGRPVLGIGPSDGDAAEILVQTGAGEMFAYSELNQLKAKIKDWYQLYKQNNLKISVTSVEKFSRKSLTSQLAEIIHQ